MDRRQFLQVSALTAVSSPLIRIKKRVDELTGERSGGMGVIGCLPLCLEDEGHDYRYYIPLVRVDG